MNNRCSELSPKDGLMNNLGSNRAGGKAQKKLQPQFLVIIFPNQGSLTTSFW